MRKMGPPSREWSHNLRNKILKIAIKFYEFVAASPRIGGISSIIYSDTAKSKKSKLFPQGVYFFGDVYASSLFLLFLKEKFTFFTFLTTRCTTTFRFRGQENLEI